MYSLLSASVRPLCPFLLHLRPSNQTNLQWEHLHYQWFASVSLSSYIIEQNSQWRENSNVGPEKRYTPITFPSQNHHNFRLKLSSHFDHIIITLRWKCEISITYFFKDEIFSSQNYNFLTKIVSPLILQIDIKISCHDKTITFLSQFTENVITTCFVMKMLSERYRIRIYEVAQIHPIVINLWWKRDECKKYKNANIQSFSVLSNCKKWK